MIKRKGSKFVLVARHGARAGKPLSKPTTLKKVQAQERAIQAAKRARGK